MSDMIKRYEAWLNSRDTGLSSESIFNYMTLGARTYGPPSDGSDFGRCYRLLEKFPEWRPRMAEMAACPGWEKVAAAWPALEAAYASPGHEVYDMLRALRG